MSHYTTIIKVVLVAYILLTPFLDNAPIHKLAKHLAFACPYIAISIAIAVFYDLTVAVLFMVILVIWLSGHVVVRKRETTHITSKPPETFLTPPPIQHFEPCKDEEKEDTVVFKSEIAGAFRLPTSIDVPLSANAYAPTWYGSI